ncbi:tetratricopeptide repeat-containing sulfotransferase family protein [Sphingosinicella humi]|uniref:Sulfotransferase n=1 Tax=Allosphingosinicella humi TaxID=2068657 RepID=A0A2U2J5X2_9SPHN|nr:sulfotransferase [Sphingosinicella humi]PWG03702.1 sulfotransferase [Sphingosinicella humi]
MTAETPETLLRRATDLQRAGRVQDAIAAYEQLLALRPDIPAGWYNLGYLQRWAGRFEESLVSYQRALDHGVSQPEEVHLNRGVILADHLARSDAAEAELKAALALNPRYVPAWLNLGNLHEDRGLRVEAREAYEQVLALEPDHALALTRLAGLTRAAGPDDPMIDRLRQAIARPGVSAVDRADLGFALGQALDAAGAYDEAFAAYGDANAASRASAGAPVRYDAAAVESLIDRLIEAFPAPAARGQGETGAPLFICGMFRSGSTLTEQILASHSQVTAGGELNLLPTLIQRELQPYPEAAAEAGPEKLERLRRDYLERLRAIHPDAGLVTDKRPDNFLHIGLIKALFPDARIVHTRREPLDNILSIYFLHLDHSMPYALDLMDTAHWHGQYRRLMAHWKALYPKDIYDLDYEALVAEPRPTIERLLGFCGLEWKESCLSFHEANTAVRTASVWQVRQPIYRRSAGRWRNYEAHLGNVRAALEGEQGER